MTRTITYPLRFAISLSPNAGALYEGDEGGKLGQIWSFEVKRRKSVRIVGIDYSEPEQSASHLTSSIDTL